MIKLIPENWLREGSTVHALQESGRYYKGEPQMTNVFCVQPQLSPPFPEYAEAVKEAIAALIQAAPELLTALKESEDAAQAEQDFHDLGRYVNDSETFAQYVDEWTRRLKARKLLNTFYPGEYPYK